MIRGLKNIRDKKGYKYLLFNIAAFLLLAFVLDFIIGSVLKYMYHKQSSGWEYRTKYSVEDTKADILIFGASRAQQQYNPLFFEERLKKTCYNVGRDGEPIFYYYAVLKAILSRHKPKMIILDIENQVFKESQSSYDRLSVLLPFYKDHPEMRSILELRGPFEKFKLHSRIYPYNSMIFKIAMGNSGLSKKANEDIKGYVPLTRSLNEPIRAVNLSENYALDSNKFNCYKAFINDCAAAGVKLYLVCPPYFIKGIGVDKSMMLAKDVAYRKKLDFIDFARDEFFLKDSRLFDDTVHLNYTGATIFTNRLIDTLLAKNNSSNGENPEHLDAKR